MSFKIAIIGRPNVGKSTLFNRLIGRRWAIVDDTPGVTRDRREGRARLGDLEFTIIDTAGLEEGEKGSLAERMRDQTARAVFDADISLMVFDARTGVTPADKFFAQWLLKQSVPVVLLANKCEGKTVMGDIYEAYGLGLGEPIAISAEHGEGLAELYTAITEKLTALGIDPYEAQDNVSKQDPIVEDTGLPNEGDLDYEFVDDKDDADDKPLHIAIVGRPNAGKSTLINTLIKEERLVTGPEAGITRDSIAVDWQWEGLPVRLFDTAGLRKKAKITDRLEKMSATDTLRAIQFAEIVLLLIDAERGLERQDIKIAERTIDEGRGLVIAINKWDIVQDRIACERQIRDALTRSLPQLKHIKLIKMSGLTGKGTSRIMDFVEEMYEVWNARIPTSAFNRWLADVLEQHPPPSVKGRRFRIRYGAQINTRPPTFTLFCNMPKELPASYKRYLENQLRQDFNLPAVPIRILLRKSDNPYEGRRRRQKKER